MRALGVLFVSVMYFLWFYNRNKGGKEKQIASIHKIDYVINTAKEGGNQIIIEVTCTPKQLKLIRAKLRKLDPKFDSLNYFQDYLRSIIDFLPDQDINIRIANTP